MFFIHEMLLAYKLETSKHFKEVKHIMIMIIAIIYILSCLIFDQQLKITFRKSSPLKKSTLPLYSLPPKNSKSASHPRIANIENFSGPPAERMEGTMLVF